MRFFTEGQQIESGVSGSCLIRVLVCFCTTLTLLLEVKPFRAVRYVNYICMIL